MKTRKLVTISLLVAVALVLHVVERLMPIPQLAPGVKLGLANIVTLFSIFTLPLTDTILVILLRTALGSLLGGGVSSMMFSLAGGFTALAVMWLASRAKDWFSLPAISIMGALAHNVGQLFVASVIVGNFAFYAYLPVLIASGAVTGIFVGMVTRLLLISWERTGLGKAMSPSNSLKTQWRKEEVGN